MPVAYEIESGSIYKVKTVDVPNWICIIREQGYIFTKEEQEQPQGEDPSGTFAEYRIYVQENKRLFTCLCIYQPGKDDEQSVAWSNIDLAEVPDCIYAISRKVGDEGLLRWGNISVKVRQQIEQFILEVEKQTDNGASFESAVKSQAKLLCKSRDYLTTEMRADLAENYKVGMRVIEILEQHIESIKADLIVAGESLRRHEAAKADPDQDE